MFHGFLRSLVKVLVASLVVGTIMAHFGITPDRLMNEVGLSQDRLLELARQGLTWALPNLMLRSIRGTCSGPIVLSQIASTHAPVGVVAVLGRTV
jgi:hypothetical protein